MPLHISVPIEDGKTAELALRFKHKPTLGQMENVGGEMVVSGEVDFEDDQIAVEMGFAPSRVYEMHDAWERPAYFLTKKDNLLLFLEALRDQPLTSLHPELRHDHLQDLFTEAATRILTGDSEEFEDVEYFFKVLDEAYPDHRKPFVPGVGVMPTSSDGYQWPKSSIYELAVAAIEAEDEDAFNAAQSLSDHQIYDLEFEEPNCFTEDEDTYAECKIDVAFYILGTSYDSWTISGTSRFIDAELQSWVAEEDQDSGGPGYAVMEFLEAKGETFGGDELIEEATAHIPDEVPEADGGEYYAVFIDDSFFGTFYDEGDAQRFAEMSNATSAREGLSSIASVYQRAGMDDEDFDEEESFDESDINNWDEVG